MFLVSHSRCCYYHDQNLLLEIKNQTYHNKITKKYEITPKKHPITKNPKKPNNRSGPKNNVRSHKNYNKAINPTINPSNKYLKRVIYVFTKNSRS